MSFFSSNSAEQKQPTIAIIGAGLAGLTTAYRLQQKGVNVQVYEARKRVGGRIFTIKVENNMAELGAQNINDGGEAENIRLLASELDLKLIENQIHLSHRYFDGETLAPTCHAMDLDPEKLKLQLLDFAKDSKNMRDVLSKIFDKEDRLYKILSVRLAAYEGAPIEGLSPLYVDTLYYMLLGGISSSHQKSGKVKRCSIQGGNALLPEKLTEMLSGNVHLNMPLKAISKSSDHSYHLTFQNGQKIKADLLVLAIPCSVYNDITFGNDLIPKKQLECIRNVQYGTNAKLLVPFSQPYSKNMTFMNDWAVSFFNIDCTVLNLVYTGNVGKFSSSNLRETYLKDRPMLEKGFEELCPPWMEPVLADDEFLTSYNGPVGHSWPNDPYAKGSYSYIAPGQEALLTAIHNHDGEVVKTLFAPIDQTLYFAGEHTTIQRDILGTMEAACESGERTARMILKSLCEENHVGKQP